MRCLFVEIYWCVVEAVLEYYWRVLIVIMKKSPVDIISTQPRGKLHKGQFICGSS
jgi:hypothetical protein